MEDLHTPRLYAVVAYFQHGLILLKERLNCSFASIYHLGFVLNHVNIRILLCRQTPYYTSLYYITEQDDDWDQHKLFDNLKIREQIFFLEFHWVGKLSIWVCPSYSSVSQSHTGCLFFLQTGTMATLAIISYLLSLFNKQ